jgi:hypothetical protein
MQPLRGNFFALKKPGQQMKNDKQQRKEQMQIQPTNGKHVGEKGGKQRKK